MHVWYIVPGQKIIAALGLCNKWEGIHVHAQSPTWAGPHGALNVRIERRRDHSFYLSTHHVSCINSGHTRGTFPRIVTVRVALCEGYRLPLAFIRTRVTSHTKPLQVATVFFSPYFLPSARECLRPLCLCVNGGVARASGTVAGFCLPHGPYSLGGGH